MQLDQHTSIPITPEFISTLERDVYASDPVLWVRNRLGADVWSKQRDILQSLVTHRLTAVPSCHGPGKSAVAGMAACWWIDSHAPGTAAVVTTATRAKQVRAILWKEIRRWHARGGLNGRLNQTEWLMDVDVEAVNGTTTTHEKLVAFGTKPADYDEEAFQGIHEPYVLFIGDEASGLPEDLCVAGRSLTANDLSRYLLIGNPIDPDSYFARCCKDGSGFNVIWISYKDTPNFTNEPFDEDVKQSLIGPVYVAEMISEWGENHPRCISRLQGKFPADSEDNLIPSAWTELAVERELPISSNPINELGVDVGGGSDWNIIAHRLDSTVRIILRNREPNTMTQLGYVVRALKQTGATRAKVDYIGIGKGMVDRAREICVGAKASGDKDKYRLYSRIIPVDVRNKASEPDKYYNLRTEGFYNLRRRFETGDIAILDGTTPSTIGTASVIAGQAQAIKTKPRSDGREMVMSKEEMVSRGILKKSPDELDAVNNAFITPPRKKGKGRRGKVVGGSRLKRAIKGVRR